MLALAVDEWTKGALLHFFESVLKQLGLLDLLQLLLLCFNILLIPINKIFIPVLQVHLQQLVVTVQIVVHIIHVMLVG